MNEITATDSRRLAGTRSSDTVLKMVVGQGFGDASAKIVVEVSNGKRDGDEPKWTSTAGNLWSTNGDDFASWDGNPSSDITASLEGDSKTVKIETRTSVEVTKTIADKNKASIKDTVDKIEGWLDFINGAERKAGLTFAGKIEVSSQAVDFYNDGERFGEKQKITGGVSASLGELNIEKEWPTSVPGIKGIIGFNIKTLSFGASASATYDESKPDPWDDPFSGQGKIEAGVVASFGGAVGIPGGATVVKLQGDVGVSASGTSDLRLQGKEVKMKNKFKASPITWDITAKWQLAVEFELFSLQGEWGQGVEHEGQEETIYTFN